MRVLIRTLQQELQFVSARLVDNARREVDRARRDRVKRICNLIEVKL